MADMMKAPEGEGSILDILLGDKVGNVERELPEARYWVDRLSSDEMRHIQDEERDASRNEHNNQALFMVGSANGADTGTMVSSIISSVLAGAAIGLTAGGPAGAAAGVLAGGLPLCRETDWDFETNTPVWRGGNPVFVTGGRAVLVWAWNALHTERFACDVFRAGYGLDLGDLLGRTCTEEVRRSEAVRETLLVNPYILDVSQVSVDFDGSWLRLGFRLKTIYGEVSMDGCDITV